MTKCIAGVFTVGRPGPGICRIDRLAADHTIVAVVIEIPIVDEVDEINRIPNITDVGCAAPWALVHLCVRIGIGVGTGIGTGVFIVESIGVAGAGIRVARRCCVTGAGVILEKGKGRLIAAGGANGD